MMASPSAALRLIGSGRLIRLPTLRDPHGVDNGQVGSKIGDTAGRKPCQHLSVTNGDGAAEYAWRPEAGVCPGVLAQAAHRQGGLAGNPPRTRCGLERSGSTPELVASFVNCPNS